MKKILLVLVLCSFSVLAQDFKKGDEIPEFKLWMLDGSRITKDSIKGKVVVFKFWFTSCMPCKADIPDMNNIVERYKDNDDVLFIAPALDRKEAIQDFLNYTPFDFQIAYSAMDVSQQFNSYQAYPFYYVVGKDGRFVYVDNPRASSQVRALKKAIKKALKV